MVARRLHGRAAAVRARALGVPHPRPARRPAGADPPARDRGGRRLGARRARPARRALDGRATGGSLVVDLGTGSGRHRPVARGRAARRRGLGHRRVARRARGGPGQPRRPRAAGAPGHAWPRARGSTPCPTDLRGRVDLVVSNPPYVAADDAAARPRSPTGSPGRAGARARPGSRRCCPSSPRRPAGCAGRAPSWSSSRPTRPSAVADAARAAGFVDAQRRARPRRPRPVPSSPAI